MLSHLDGRYFIAASVAMGRESARIWGADELDDLPIVQGGTSAYR